MNNEQYADAPTPHPLKGLNSECSFGDDCFSGLDFDLATHFFIVTFSVYPRSMALAGRLYLHRFLLMVGVCMSEEQSASSVAF